MPGTTRKLGKDWRMAKSPRASLSRPDAARADLTAGEFMRRELQARISAKLSRKVFDAYRGQPDLFAREALGLSTICPVQQEMFDALAEGSNPVLLTAEKVGGSYGAAAAVLWWLHSCGPSSQVLVTAPTKNLTEGQLWASVKQLTDGAPQRFPGQYYQSQIDLSESWYASCFTATDAHRYVDGKFPRALVIVDAADRYPEDAWRSVLQLIDANDARFVFIGRPVDDGLWAELGADGIQVSALGHPNLKRGGKIIVPGCCTKKSVQDVVKKYGEDSPEYEQLVLANPIPHLGPVTLDEPGPATHAELATNLRDAINDTIGSRIERNRYARMKPSEFARKRLWVRSKTGDIVQFEAWPLQIHYEEEKAKAAALGYTKCVLLKYRRGGFTTYEQAESYAMAVSKPNVRCLTLAHTEENTTEIFRISKRYWENDPHRPPIRGVGNARRLEFPSLDSVYFTATASGNAPGRGDTLSRVHGSEVSKWCVGPNQAEVVTDLVAGLSEACSHGTMVMESTPNGVDGWFCPTYREAKARVNNWYPIFLPWFVDPLNTVPEGDYNEQEILETIDPEEKELLEMAARDWSIVITPAQIAWRRKKMRDLGSLFPQEYPEDDETCFLTSGTPYYDTAFLIKLRKSMKKARKEHVEVLPGGTITRFRKAQKGRKYVAGSDTSEGVKGGDLNGCWIKDKRTGEQIAWAHGLWRPEELADIGIKLCREYNNAMWGIERNNHGHAVIQEVKRRKYRYLYKFDSKRVGWDTNSSTRPEMLHDGRVFALDAPQLIHDDVYVGQCLTFKLQTSGKFEADPGCHDDAIFGWDIAEQMRIRAGSPGIAVG